MLHALTAPTSETRRSSERSAAAVSPTMPLRASPRPAQHHWTCHAQRSGTISVRVGDGVTRANERVARTGGGGSSRAWQAPMRYGAARMHVIGAAPTSPRLHPPRNAPMFSSAEVHRSGANPLTFGEFWRARPFVTSTDDLLLRIVSPSPFIWARSEAPIITESPNVG